MQRRKCSGAKYVQAGPAVAEGRPETLVVSPRGPATSLPGAGVMDSDIGRRYPGIEKAVIRQLCVGRAVEVGCDSKGQS